MKQRKNDLMKELREQKQMSQADLAKEVGVTQAAISKIELGETESPSLDLARAIAKALDSSTEELFPEKAA